MNTPTETEVKIPVRDLPSVAGRLHGEEFTLLVPREFEANTLYDTPDESLRQAGMLLRLRQIEGRCLITWKGPAIAGPHKSRPEIETLVTSRDALHLILGHLGYQPRFRYEKYRTEFRHNQQPSGIVTLDETPIGNFLELEGTDEWIDWMAPQLGFAPKDYVLDSYGGLYYADCARRGLEPGNMVFAS